MKKTCTKCIWSRSTKLWEAVKIFDDLKKHKQITDGDFERRRKPKKDKVFIVILIVFSVILVIGFITGNGGAVNSSGAENNFKFRFNISDGIMVGVLIIGYVVMRIRKGRGH